MQIIDTLHAMSKGDRIHTKDLDKLQRLAKNLTRAESSPREFASQSKTTAVLLGDINQTLLNQGSRIEGQKREKLVSLREAIVRCLKSEVDFNNSQINFKDAQIAKNKTAIKELEKKIEKNRKSSSNLKRAVTEWDDGLKNSSASPYKSDAYAEMRNAAEIARMRKEIPRREGNIDTYEDDKRKLDDKNRSLVNGIDRAKRELDKLQSALSKIEAVDLKRR
ncbi:hypothetical protein K6W16_08060 [Burkholderia dolosa]|uniref:Uncharacterized protein n=1 Tax=Burkholderia dolosa TaxID=152500 RepID=A0A892IFU8_9BURK|nr:MULTISPECIES: hypothetical protein [Burkholderia]AKE05773.1 hypothetical protein XM57_24545 [Burkholderia cepacia]AJY10535.1 hypothetical protein AK34_4182 [Burkholderia dolosa AU0158]AYZ93895.1 hypothetical protein EGY28_01585 [Burkholderia dolosa]ETP63713.1 hypothetical protein BDSB_18545 [Burkholderia dolosa PC543]MBR8420354.1 hypothetical protein [Burkholderia dolosa]